MQSALKSSARFNCLLIAGFLTLAGASAMAQGAAAASPAGAPGERMMQHHDPAKMQAMMARHHAELKTRLQITAAQEGAWTAYSAAMQPPAQGTRSTPEQRAEFDKLTTPERIDKMAAMRAQRMTDMNAAMDKRGAATKALYAALSPEQQKVFDAEHKQRAMHGGRGGHRNTGAQKS